MSSAVAEEKLTAVITIESTNGCDRLEWKCSNGEKDYMRFSFQDWVESGRRKERIQNDINHLIRIMDPGFGNDRSRFGPDDAIVFCFTKEQAKAISNSEEYKERTKYDRDSIKDDQNPGKEFGIAPYFYGMKIAIKVLE